MPAPSPLSIATSSVSRLIREEASYHAELAKQEERLRKALEDPDTDGDNVEFTLKQEVRYKKKN
jgi:tubulin-specific chaperone A